MNARRLLLSALLGVVGALLVALWSRSGAVPGARLGSLRLLWRVERPILASAPAPRKSPGASDQTVPAKVEGAPALRHSHPITPVHQRIYQENSLIGRLNAAMDRGDTAELRRVNAQYRAEYPEDGQRLQDGYDLIARCQERRTADDRAEAERLWHEQRGSTLRRYVRRYCLE